MANKLPSVLVCFHGVLSFCVFDSTLVYKNTSEYALQNVAAVSIGLVKVILSNGRKILASRFIKVMSRLGSK